MYVKTINKNRQKERDRKSERLEVTDRVPLLQPALGMLPSVGLKKMNERLWISKGGIKSNQSLPPPSPSLFLPMHWFSLYSVCSLSQAAAAAAQMEFSVKKGGTGTQVRLLFMHVEEERKGNHLTRSLFLCSLLVNITCPVNGMSTVRGVRYGRSIQSSAG